MLCFFIRESWMVDAAQAAGGSWTLTQQLLVQVQAVAATIIYTIVVSGIIVVLVDKTVGLRLNENEEKSGMDYSLHGEHGYGLINLN
jgi:Amt family ammonium transporter